MPRRADPRINYSLTLLAIPAEIRQEKLPKTNSSTSELLTTESRYFKFQPLIGGYNLRLTMDRPEVRA